MRRREGIAMNKYLFYVLFLLAVFINAQEQEQKQETNATWGWSPFDIGISFDVLDRNTFIDYKVLTANLIFRQKIILGSCIMSFHQAKDGNSIKYSYLPFELGFIPLIKFYDPFSIGLYVYWRSEWMFSQIRHPILSGQFASQTNEFYGTVGTRIFFLASQKTGMPSLFSSVFIEYTTSNELKIGISLDGGVSIIAGLAALIGLGKKEQDELEKEKEITFPDNDFPNEWEQPKVY
jgi:hypothetical protein